MKDSIKNRKKNLLALCLSVMMLSSVTAIAACGGNSSDSSSSDSSSSTTTTVKDEKLITNSDFETFDSKYAIDVDNVTGWTRANNSTASGSAPVSSAASGIIDLSDKGWTYLMETNANYNVQTMTEKEAKAAWKELTIRDKLAYYKRWKEENNKSSITTKDLDFYESLEVDSEDKLPSFERFSTHDQSAENTKILMIHNDKKSTGTAQKYTSSSTVTVKAGTSAKFSVWVKTLDLTSPDTEGVDQEAVDKGAYISVSHSVGGKTLDDYTIENINTERMDEATLSNGWKQYSFVLKGSFYADTTFSIVLGLGQGGGSYYADYVNGYAFFDDIQCETISNATYKTTVDEWVNESVFDVNDTVKFEYEDKQKIVDVSDAANEARNHFALDFYGQEFSVANEVLSNTTASVTTTETKNVTYSSLKNDSVNTTAPWLGGGFSADNDITEVFANVAAMQTKAETANNKFLTSIYNEHFKDNAFAKDKQTLLLMSADGVAYTAKSSYDFNFSQAPDGYLAISFFVKTSDMQGYTGAGVTLIDGENKTSFSSIDTTNIDPVKIEDDEDVYEGWQQYFFFVENDSDKDDVTFSLSFSFGPTSVEESVKRDSYFEGFAAFTDFKVYSMSKDEYESAQSGSYSKVVAIKGDKEAEKAEGEGFDKAAGTPIDGLEKGIAHLQNYRGVYNDNAYITGKKDDSAEENLNVNAGLLNKKHFTAEDGYFGTATGAWMNGIKSLASGTSTEVWNTIFGNDCSQPLFIWNETQTKPYGFISKSKTTISANTYKAVSVRVKGSVGATASVYLIDMDKDNYDNADVYDKTQSIGRTLTYWYDSYGNICTGDSEEKSTQIAFHLQTNGLYKANKNWDGYKKLSDAQKTAYFANLSAYKNTDKEGNLLVGAGGATHDYTGKHDGEGLNGIAFYKKADGVYCADKDTNIVVENIAALSSEILAPRYSEVAAKELKTEITFTSNDWTTVTFYIHTGDTAKEYRLEVWSGTRNGDTGNNAGTFVAFDINTPPSDETTIKGLLEEYDKEIEEGEDKFYGVFSYFDTDKHLRYNADLDKTNVGNLYKESYVPTDYEKGIAYLNYDKQENRRVIFADYQYSEKTITAAEADKDDDTDSDNDSTDETPNTNVWLLASSLSIAGVLVLAVASIIIRKIVKKVRKNKALQASMKHNKK